jgi:hypothetical protein
MNDEGLRERPSSFFLRSFASRRTLVFLGLFRKWRALTPCEFRGGKLAGLEGLVKVANF